MRRYTLKLVQFFSGKPFDVQCTQEEHDALETKLKQIGITVLAKSAQDAHVKAINIFKDLMPRDIYDEDRINGDQLVF